MDNGLKLSEDGKTVIGINDTNITYVTIPYGITTIGNSAFYGCSSLQSIDIPNSVTTIGDSAFKFCSALKSIEIPNSVTTIGEYAFVGCSALQSIDIPNSVATIGASAFEGCSSLQSIDIPNSVTTIGNDAFLFCSALQSINISEDNPNYTSVNGVLFNKELTTIIRFPEGGKLEIYNIPNSVTTIGDSAFKGCLSLQSIEIPNSVTTIGQSAFEGCSSLQNINISEDNPNYTSVNGVLFNKGLTTIIKFSEGKRIERYNIPNSVTTIGGTAFMDCSVLQSIDIPNSVTTIEDCAFLGCSALQSIDIPNSVTTIGDCAFLGCSSLQSIHLHWTQLGNIQIDNYALSVNFEECTLYVPPGTRWEYRHHPVFGKFKNIEIEKQ